MMKHVLIAVTLIFSVTAAQAQQVQTIISVDNDDNLVIKPKEDTAPSLRASSLKEEQNVFEGKSYLEKLLEENQAKQAIDGAQPATQ